MELALIVSISSSFLLVTPRSRMEFRTMTENAMAAMASIVRYPSVKPTENGAVVSKPSAGAPGSLLMYIIMALMISATIVTRSTGVRNRPMLSTMRLGL
ncbi:hypothetical protein SARO104761_02355 [Salinicoccus roseus]